MKTFPLIPLAGAVALALSTHALASEGDGDAAASKVDVDKLMADDWQKPAPIQALEREGLTFHETFEVEGNLTGYAMSMQGQPVPVFLMEDGERAIIGTMIDGTGADVMQDQLNQIIQGPANEAAWELMQDHQVVVEGDADAPNVLYTITDPNCPYCHRMWQSTQPLVEAGQLQVRHIMVGMLSEDSSTKAAAILQAEDPAQAMQAHQTAFENGGIEPASEIDEDIQAVLDDGMKIMEAGMVSGTPASFYKDSEGTIQRIGGAVPTEEIEARFNIEG